MLLLFRIRVRGRNKGQEFVSLQCKNVTSPMDSVDVTIECGCLWWSASGEKNYGIR